MLTLLTADTIRISFLPERQVEALVIHDGRIVFAGTRAEASRRYPNPDEIRELTGTLIPGLVESHIHTVFTGMTEQWANLRPEVVSSVDALIGAVEQFGPHHGWYRGWGYDDTMLADGRHPDRLDLDRVSTTLPVLVTHISGHFAVANTKALELAGLTDATPDPAGGAYVRDGEGQATGLLWGIGAVRAVRDQCPPPDRADGLRAARSTMEQAVSHGITQIHDMGIGSQLAAEELELLRELAASGAMPVRLIGYLRADLVAAVLEREPELFRTPTDSLFQLRGAKMWADGSIQGLSASVIEAYHGCPETHGNLLLTAADIVEAAGPLLDAGAQLAVHANGDGAIAEVIEAYRQLRERPGAPHGIKHRIEHFQMAHPEHIAAAAAAGASASLFTNHVHYWGDRHRDRFIGPERAARMNPLRECLDQGLTVGFHSDSPVTPMNVLATIDTAVTRATRDGCVLGVEQGVTVAEAFHVATAMSAELVGLEAEVGTLDVGKLADLVLLDRDPLSTGTLPGQIAAAAVKATMVGGVWVHGA